ncbi:hypothetical protein SETIT_2G022400v2 [Setaria italica]|uniref:F-box domain-containing protein n=1 Tax=Setaria italica TaxID=4555 RepID=A0A368PV20_SETIT|nr:hypothetical protein SETIT_2G022400v2 [Setaria italica]
MAPELMAELGDEVLLRIPADDPATLVRASLACKRWRRLILDDPVFHRRRRELHRPPPPLLGFACNLGSVSDFVPASSFCCRPHARGWRALDARHGRVLLHGAPLQVGRNPLDASLVVWDPVADERRELPKLPHYARADNQSWNAAVLCAPAASGAAGDRNRRRPFTVVLPARWERTPLPRCVLPDECHYKRIVLMSTEDGRLGFATVVGSNLFMCSSTVGSGGGAQQSRSIELKAVLPAAAYSSSVEVVGFADGARIIFLWTVDGIYSIDLMSGRVKKAYKETSVYGVFPCVSFCAQGDTIIMPPIHGSAFVQHRRDKNLVHQVVDKLKVLKKKFDADNSCGNSE